jgi:hypothetical protein
MKWAALVPASNRPAILNESHGDWIWPLKVIPRSWNAFFGEPTPEKPIPSPGSSSARTWPWPYFAVQTKGGWLFRIGFRWDDVDRYYDLGVTVKREAQ